jgi:hypothetical protein
MPGSSAPPTAALRAHAAVARTGTSIVRCGRCGETQQVDLAESVVVQVRPFVHAHLRCGVDTVTVPAGSRSAPTV